MRTLLLILLLVPIFGFISCDDDSPSKFQLALDERQKERKTDSLKALVEKNKGISSWINTTLEKDAEIIVLISVKENISMKKAKSILKDYFKSNTPYFFESKYIDWEKKMYLPFPDLEHTLPKLNDKEVLELIYFISKNHTLSKEKVSSIILNYIEAGSMYERK